MALGSTVLFTLLACACYASFLLFIDWSVYVIPPSEQMEIVLRCTFLAFTGFLAYSLTDAQRKEASRSREVADALQQANEDLRAAEQEVRRGERLAALGQLTAGLAHEIRNPLVTIRSSAEILGRSVREENEIAREMGGNILAEVDRADVLITKFLQFARPLEITLEPADITEVIDEAIAEFQRSEAADQISVYTNYTPDVPNVPLDREMMVRVFFNLLANAAQASESGSVITARTKLTDGHVEAMIVDKGRGIPAERLESIFNPFVTDRDEGVGLGLAIVSKIVDLHEGTVLVESEPGQGSTFRVRLPLEKKA
jgi:signal transduction histidine kinase